MYYPSSTQYTTQSYRKFRKQEDIIEQSNKTQEQNLYHTQKQVQQLQKELEQAKLEQQNNEKLRKQAEEKLYLMLLKYEDMNKECMNLREKIGRMDGEKAVIRAQGEGEMKSLHFQINFIEKQMQEIKNENEKLKQDNEQLRSQVLEMKNREIIPNQQYPPYMPPQMAPQPYY